MVDDYDIPDTPVPTDNPEPNEAPVQFSKTDIDGNELPGATIEVQKENGDVVEKWVSDGTAKTINLEEGEYIFHEVAAPEGYVIATDISFSVDKDGNVTSKDVTVKGDDKNIITMVDDFAKPDEPTTLDETPDTPEDTPEDTPQDTPQTQKVTKTVKTVKTSEVQTGDSNVMYIAGIAALLALIGAAAAFAVRRKENN
jgi:LPXTG-motif cell wall-anchored protein